MEDIYFIQGSIEMRDNEEAEPWMIENWFCNFLSECCPECIMEDPQDHTFSFGFHGTGSYPEEDIKVEPVTPPIPSMSKTEREYGGEER